MGNLVCVWGTLQYILTEVPGSTEYVGLYIMYWVCSLSGGRCRSVVQPVRNELCMYAWRQEDWGVCGSVGEKMQDERFFFWGGVTSRVTGC